MSVEERIDLKGRSLRQHTARGTIINSAFQVGLAGLGLVRRLAVVAFLTQEEFGLWGIIITTLTTLAWLKQIGIADKYIQQSEPDQEAAYQKAFTLEFMLSLAFFAVLVAVMPLYALAYGHSEIILPGIVLALSVPISSFKDPLWIPYRRMQFVRQRTLSAIDPVVALVVTVVAGALGAGYWCLVIGALAGSIVSAIVLTITCPYRVRLRFERGTLKEYARFSWPLLGYRISNLASVQGVMLVGSQTVGLRGLGSIALVASITTFAERVDAIVSTTLYPAVCAIRDRTELMFEAFVTSNRIALMWAMPFGVGLTLFAADLVHFVLGDRWESAIGLLTAFGLIAGFRQVGFNWQIFMRAVNDTKPIFVAAATNTAVVAAVMLPLMFELGLAGYAAGMAIGVAVQIVQRGYFLKRLFPRYNPLRHLVRAVLPSVPAAGLVLLARVIPGDRTPTRAVVEFALYVVVTLVATWLAERKLLQEIVGYLRGRRGGIRSSAAALPRTESPSPS